MHRLYLTTLFLAYCSLAFAQGNPRDPLSAQFRTGVPVERGIPAKYEFGDARLNDVCFVNPQRGWAVGDRGVVWTTFDGGASWQLLETPIDCTLRCVQFFNESFGIAVGHYWFPATNQIHSRQGRGVILITLNGGQSWIARMTPDLPPLYSVKIFAPTMILVAGAASERFPSGAAISRDGGQTWQSASSALSDGFAAADFYDPKTGIGIGFHGIMQQFQDGIMASQTATFGLRRVSAVKVNSDGKGVYTWAVGDRGLVLSTPDHGFRWGTVPGALPGNAAESVDLKTIEAHGGQLWVAGNPGSVIYMSNDAGQTWRGSFTGVTATIRKIVFVDALNGWAVGDLGTILTTRNGGQTWTVQRTGGTKLSVLGLFGEAETIPYEAFAALSANQGYLGGCVILFRNEQNNTDWDGRFHESMIRVGGSIGTELGTFPILPRELWTSADNLVEHIQRTTDGRGMAQLRERLVRVIRQWRPEVLLTSNYTNRFTDSAVEELTLSEVQIAVGLAGDSSAYPHHLTELGLSPWNVKKVYLPLKNGMQGDFHYNTSDPTVQFGTPLGEMTFVSRGLIGAERVPTILGFANGTPSSELPTRGDFFVGIPIMPSTDGRRAYPGIIEFQDEQRRQALARRNVLHVLRNTRESSNSAGLVAHATNLVGVCSPDSAVQILLEMAEQFHQEGDWFAATETYMFLTRQYVQHPLVRQAFVRLMQYAASGEIAAGEQQSNFAVEQISKLSASPSQRQNFSGQNILQIESSLQTSGGRTFIPDHTRNDPQQDRALLLAPYLSQNFPDLADDVVLQFAVASAMRRHGREQDAARFYWTRGNQRFDDVWGVRARTEHWLTVQDKSQLPMEQQELPMPALVSAPTNVKPFLDGKFDDEKDRGVWRQGNVYSLTPATPRQRLSELLQTGTPVRRVGAVREERLRSTSHNFGTQVMFLHDAEYLYIGLRCPKVPGIDYPPVPEGQRLRDIGMQDQDRVEILIDVERDYGTYYSLTIDSRGWVTDACWGANSWNPQWFVARHEDEQAWYIESAMRLSELSPGMSERAMRPTTTWGIAIRRLVPGVGIECWNAENSFELNEGFGLLVLP